LNVMWGPATVAVICVSAAGVENPAGWTMASVVAPGACGSNGVAALVTAPMNGTGVASVPTAVSELVTGTLTPKPARNTPATGCRASVPGVSRSTCTLTAVSGEIVVVLKLAVAKRNPDGVNDTSPVSR